MAQSGVWRFEWRQVRSQMTGFCLVFMIIHLFQSSCIHNFTSFSEMTAAYICTFASRKIFCASVRREYSAVGGV